MKNKKTYFILAISLIFIFIPNFLSISILNLSTDAIRMIGIFIGAILLWLFVGIDWTSILVLCSLTTLTIATPNDIIQNAFGNSTIWFLIFSFILTYSLSETGLLKRIALLFVNSKIAQKSNLHFAIMVWLAVMVVGSFIAPTVTFLLFYSLLEEIFQTCNLQKGNKFANMLMVGTAFSTSISCAMTPIAHTFPLMAMGFYTRDTGLSINYFRYMSISIPICIILFIIMIIVLNSVYRNTEKITYSANELKIGKITKKEKISGIVFLLVVFIWIMPGLIVNVLPSLSKELTALGTTIPAMIGIVLLSIIQIDNKPVLNFKEAIKNGVAWNSIMLCATTLCVGKYLTNSELGITKLITDLFTPIMNNVSLLVFVFAVIALVCIMTNLVSNIVTVTVTYSIVIPIATVINPEIIPILVIIIGMIASLAFATPPSIAHIAIAGGSGWSTPKDLLKSGSILTVCSILISTVMISLFL